MKGGEPQSWPRSGVLPPVESRVRIWVPVESQQHCCPAAYWGLVKKKVIIPLCEVHSSLEATYCLFMDIAKYFGCQVFYDVQRSDTSQLDFPPPPPPLCSYKLDQIRDREGGVFNQGRKEVLQALQLHEHSTLQNCSDGKSAKNLLNLS